jgi:CP family cyanate transporter-like MFS transporter
MPTCQAIPAILLPLNDASRAAPRTEAYPKVLDLSKFSEGARTAAPRRLLLALVIGMAAVAFNLRPGLTSVGPVLPELRRGLDLSSTLASFLTALPLICFALCSPVPASLMRRFRAESLIAWALGVLSAGLAVRIIPSVAALIAGTAVVGGALAVINVSLPVLVKRHAPDRAGVLTGIYTMMISVGAALGAGITVPVADALGGGWQAALAVWALPAIPALAYWAIFVVAHSPRDGTRERGSTAPHSRREFFRSRVTWAVACFFGLQSGVFYAAVGWVPSMLHDDGFSIASAGALMSLALVVGIPMGLAAPVIAMRRADRRGTVAAFVLLAGAGLLGLLLAPGVAPLWMVLFGAGIGGTFPLGLMLMVIRTESARETQQLSGLAQGFGYTLAIAGPFTVGIVHGATRSWTLPLSLMAAVMLVPTMVAGLAAGGRRG